MRFISWAEASWQGKLEQEERGKGEDRGERGQPGRCKRGAQELKEEPLRGKEMNPASKLEGSTDSDTAAATTVRGPTPAVAPYPYMCAAMEGARKETRRKGEGVGA
jgi:hypothetical protein